MCFFKETSKKLAKQDSLNRSPGTAFNVKLNGTYPSTVSFLYVENLTKKFKKWFCPY